MISPQASKRLDAIAPHTSASFILHGAAGSGKTQAAYALAKRLNCAGDEKGMCPACRQFEAGTYPDLHVLAPELKASITIEQVRALIHSLSLGLYYTHGTRIVIITSAHSLTPQAQNALLKVVEEPPVSTMFVLVTDQPDALLDTIRSRCAHIYFAPTNEREQDATELNPELAQSVERFDAMSPFERLLLATRIASIDGQADIFGRLLHEDTVQKLIDNTADAPKLARRMAALDHFRTYCQGNVATKVALECLMLEAG